MNVLAKGRKRSLSSAFQSGSCTAWELIFERAHQTPEAVAIAAPGRNPLCFGDLESHITAVAVALNAMGVGRNDRIALVLPNGPEMAVAFLAVASCATCAPLNAACTALEKRGAGIIVKAACDGDAREIAGTHLLLAVGKFRRRFDRVLELLREQGRSPQEVGMPELDRLWEAVKREEEAGKGEARGR